jgi:putative ABC transport system permease protein
MSEAVAGPDPRRYSGSESVEGLLNIRICWRNLWRNRRRTWLTAGGIAFAVFLVVFIMAMQVGQYGIMKENATSLITGQIQVQAADYIEDDRFEHTIHNASGVLEIIRSTPGVIAAAPRAEAFGLANAGERSFGIQVLGLEMAAESDTTRFAKMISSGRALASSAETVIGIGLARNLGIGLGDEVVVLGSGREGGVAAMVLNVVGLLETGMADLDRAVLLASLPAVQDAFGLDDQIHTVAIKTTSLSEAPRIIDRLQPRLSSELSVRSWEAVLPEVVQGIEVDKVGGQFMYAIIMILVAFSVVNSFIMTVFERTREFGMLRAIGMRPLKIIIMVQWEALFVCLLGIAIGLALAVPLIFWLMDVGIYLGESMEAYATQFYMPDSLYPAFSVEALLTAPIVMLISTQIAAVLPALSIRRLKPVEALRAD